MECQKRIALEQAVGALKEASRELRAALQQPDAYPLPTITDVLLGPETDQAIRQMYHDLQLTQIQRERKSSDAFGTGGRAPGDRRDVANGRVVR